MEPRNQVQGMNFASLCSLAGRFDNPIPTRFLAPHRLFKNSSSGYWLASYSLTDSFVYCFCITEKTFLRRKSIRTKRNFHVESQILCRNTKLVWIYDLVAFHQTFQNLNVPSGVIKLKKNCFMKNISVQFFFKPLFLCDFEHDSYRIWSKMLFFLMIEGLNNCKKCQMPVCIATLPNFK